MFLQLVSLSPRMSFGVGIRIFDYPFNLDVFVEIVDKFHMAAGVRQTWPQHFSKAVSIGLCLPDTWTDSRVIGNIHHSLL